MTGAWARFRGSLLGAYRTALARALPPKPQVARHWESVEALAWVGVVAAADGFHLALSFGRLLRSVAPSGQRDTTGAFRLAGSLFPGVDEAALSLALTALVPAQADGATRAFLRRVAAQLAAAEVAAALEREAAALPMPAAPGFEVALVRGVDALAQPVRTPRLPGPAAGRVREALGAVDEALRARALAVFDAPQQELLAAVRGLPAETS